MQSDLFEPVQMGRYQLTNRIVMAPLTRSRAGEDGVPTVLMTEYYRQRASAGLIISEGCNVSAQGRGYAYTPGLFDLEQILAWQKVTHAVHHVGGHIFAQLWHVGRISHPSLQPGRSLPVAPSAILPTARVFTRKGFEPCLTPRALLASEIDDIVQQYVHAARNALAAGFDGVEIHAANGYLIEQFLRESSNQRADRYGGSLENRARLLLEVTDAVCVTCHPERVGVRLSPANTVNDSHPDRDAQRAGRYLIGELNERRLAYLHMIEGITGGARHIPDGFDFLALRQSCRSLYMANSGYDRELALQARRLSQADLIAFGRDYIANPDLVQRLRLDAPLNSPDPETFFGGGAHGYTDYAPLADDSRLSA